MLILKESLIMITMFIKVQGARSMSDRETKGKHLLGLCERDYLHVVHYARFGLWYLEVFVRIVY